MGRSRNLAIGMAAGALLLGLFLYILLRPTDAGAMLQARSDFAHAGVASCAGSTCHGRSEADGRIVRQDELRSWQNEASPAGAHSRAWRVLTEPRGRAIAARYDGNDPTRRGSLCLGCHTIPAPEGRRGPRFQPSDGVGCEGCHGAAGGSGTGWLESHYSVGASHAANAARGMIKLENPRVRASVCLDCHFGSRELGQFVDHRMMAAGHPRISFELDLFSTLQQHHDEDVDYIQRKGRINSVQMWAVGQTMALDRSLDLFAGERGGKGLFPEFYFFDCHTCHRQIYDDPRIDPKAERNPGRPIPPGMPAYNDENMIMLSAAARVAAPALAAGFDRDSRAFHAALAKDRAAAIAAAGNLRESARALGAAFSRAAISRAQTFEIIDLIADKAISERFTDYSGSVQAVMAVDTLLSALVNADQASAAAADSIRVDINSAYRAVHDPNAYRPRDFRVSLGRAAAAIRRLR